MDWITNLLKHLGISRSVVGAVFLTSAVLYVGPRVVPSYVEPVQKEWAPVVLAVFLFSGCLLFFWGCSGVWVAARRRWKATSAFIASIQLNQTEQEVLLAMGERPSEALNLEHVNYEGLSLSRLEVLALMHALAEKGLVSLNPYADNLVSLTATGRQRALEIQRAASAKLG